jgi:hypothetical protein
MFYLYCNLPFLQNSIPEFDNCQFRRGFDNFSFKNKYLQNRIEHFIKSRDRFQI